MTDTTSGVVTIDGQPAEMLCGWIDNPSGYGEFARQPDVGEFSTAAGNWMEAEIPDQVELWHPLLKCKPTWRRGAQALGSCVAWGAELCATFLLAMQAVAGESVWIEEAATEPIYGGCRVEALDRTNGGWSDGAFGYAAAKWLRDFGVLLRVDYSKETGNPEHDLRQYSGDKEKNWGAYGCGGKGDGGKLDSVARKYPVKATTQVTKTSELRASLAGFAPVSIASNAGFGRMVRDDEGICRWVGSWGHQMMIGGYKKHRRYGWLYRIFQSWGSSCSGPDPGVLDKAFNACSWWAIEDDVSRILSSGDCWAFCHAAGWPLPGPNWKRALSTWG